MLNCENYYAFNQKLLTISKSVYKALLLKLIEKKPYILTLCPGHDFKLYRGV